MSESKNFPWGKVIERFNLDFDGERMEVVKYRAWTTDGMVVEIGLPILGEISYSVPLMHTSFGSMDAAVIGWITYRHLGLHQDALASGICRALGV